jgi:hypothetical protein
MFSKNLGEIVRNQTAEPKIGIRHSQGSPFLVASGTGMGSSRFRTHNKHSIAEKQHRSTSCCHSIDVKLMKKDSMMFFAEFFKENERCKPEGPE